ncbi:MAG: hypothetical protein NTU97_01960 [Candidatus Magasanikbacteria bacterium]|nr:hypothetical protein [Candidatus Magasanikbacteria bacterium]
MSKPIDECMKELECMQETKKRKEEEREETKKEKERREVEEKLAAVKAATQCVEKMYRESEKFKKFLQDHVSEPRILVRTFTRDCLNDRDWYIGYAHPHFLMIAIEFGKPVIYVWNIDSDFKRNNFWNIWEADWKEIHKDLKKLQNPETAVKYLWKELAED